MVLKLQVLLAGQLEVVSVTFPLKLCTDIKVSAYLAVPPRETEALVGLEEMEKSGGFTISVTDVVRTRLPLFPMISKVYVPPGVALVVMTVKVDSWAGGSVTEVGFNVQVVFEGQPLTVRATDPLNPFKGTIDRP